MNDAEEKFFRLHAWKTSFRKKVDQAIDVINRSLEITNNASVSVSWGKDSVALLHLVQSVKPDIKTIHIGDKHANKMNSYDDVISTYTQKHPTNYHEIRIDTGGDFSVLYDWLKKIDLSFIGLRLGEKGGRVFSIKKYGAIHQYKSGKLAGQWRSLPLWNWDWKDVWAYTVVNNLPYLASYDHILSGSKEHSRTSSVYTKYHLDNPNGSHGGMGMGRISKLRVIAPEYFEILKDVSPELASKS